MSMSKDGPTTSGTTSIVDETTEQIKDRAGDAAKNVGAKASSAAQDINDQAAGLLGKAKTMASNAGGKVSEALEDQKASGAERVKGISGAIRRAADELEEELPPAATYIRRAADEIDAMADAVQRRDVRQLVGDVQSFARRQPAAFLGATVLGGFAIMRLLKAPTPVHDASAAAAPGSVSTMRTALVPIDAPSARQHAGPSTASSKIGDVSPDGSSSAAISRSMSAGSEAKP